MHPHTQRRPRTERHGFGHAHPRSRVGRTAFQVLLRHRGLLVGLDGGGPLRRGLATRYDKTATIYLAGVHLAAIFIWSAR
ncbi:hypothetical protein [Streptomyces alanosinicus]|uniref:Uncharacterized protein n=1 Tax=Streptomyces alanosinicus TaxID=68171 RepID=A0A918YRV9_9ACTN|nr:hypothetical protein [Streptomyces alanosinicus]GHE13782.1 hypothetical protein GCM10010339_81920 [Streptomyces alanosinicus]